MRGDRTRDQSIKSRTLYRTELARLCWVIGLVVWFLLRVQEVASSILASPLFCVYAFFLSSLGFFFNDHFTYWYIVWFNVSIHIKLQNSIAKTNFQKYSPRGDSNPQPPDPKSDALSIAPLRHSFQKTTSTRFELARAEPSRFLIYLLNHSDTTSLHECQHISNF